MSAGRKGQAARGGEIGIFQFRNHQGRHAGPDRFLGGPEGLCRLAGGDVQACRKVGCHLPAARQEEAAMGLFQAGLADPDDRPLVACAGGERKACQGGKVPMGGFANLMDASLSQAQRECRTGPVPGWGQVKDIFQGKRRQDHMFIICSHSGESTVSRVMGAAREAGQARQSALTCNTCFRLQRVGMVRQVLWNAVPAADARRPGGGQCSMVSNEADGHAGRSWNWNSAASP